MDKKTEPVDIIDLLAYQEYKLAVLYNIFGASLPEYSELWAEMAIEEIEHQRLIRAFKPYIDEGKIYFNAMILKIAFVEAHINSIENMIKRYEQDPPGIKEALEVALNIENSMLDQDLFNYFSGDGEILKAGLDTLSKDTFKHYNDLLATAQKIGSVK